LSLISIGHDIAAAEDREARLGALIQSADTVVFLSSLANSPRSNVTRLSSSGWSPHSGPL
jgi:hypothetical protein